MNTPAHTGRRQSRVGRDSTRREPKGAPAAGAMNGASEKAMTADSDDFDTGTLMPPSVFGKFQVRMPAERAS